MHRTNPLAQFFEFNFERAERALEHFAVGAAGGVFELRECVCAREAQRFASFASGARFGRFIYGRLGCAPCTLFRFLYLVFDRLAFPSSRHLTFPLSLDQDDITYGRLLKPTKVYRKTTIRP
jgi:hypothetical protein